MHTTIDAFILALDVDKDKAIDKSEFLKIFQELDIQLDVSQKANIFTHFDTEKRGKIYF